MDVVKDAHGDNERGALTGRVVRPQKRGPKSQVLRARDRRVSGLVASEEHQE
jgi:hypothetical protein